MNQVRVPFTSPNITNISGGEKPDFGTFIAGGTKGCLLEWLKITHDPWILEAIRGVKIEWENLPSQSSDPAPYFMSGEKRRVLGEEIARLLSRGVLEKCSWDNLFPMSS